MLIPAVALLGALIPTVVYVLCVWWLDRFEKEPVWLLALAFVWGAVPAIILSALLEFIVDHPIYELGGESLLAALVSASVGAPIIEESAKGLVLVLLVLLVPREFDDELDGIVYGAMVGFGFAFSENAVGYFLPILQEEGIATGLVNIFMRSVVFGCNHALWTATLGVALGHARLSRERKRRVLVPVAGWLLAVSLHAMHNAAATLSERTFCLTLGLSALLGWSGIVLLLGVAVVVLRRESRWLERGLYDEVRPGGLSAGEYAILRSSSRRLGARARALLQGGLRAHRAVGRYFQCATELAFAKRRAVAAGEAEMEGLRRQLASLQPGARPWL